MIEITRGQADFSSGKVSPSVRTFWAATFCAIAILTFVKWTAITFGPSGNKAIAAIQVAQLKILEAEYEIARRGWTNVHDESISDAKTRLERAWTHLELKQYPETIAHAQQTTLPLRALLD
ncbi:MAG: hypothetical protein ACREQO_00115 [Candidatus Binatia bacterium]